MVTCSFSGKEIPKGKGKMFIRNDGRVFYFFSNREFKLFNANKRPARLRWTAEARKAKEMNMAAASHDKGKAPAKK